MSKLFRNLNRIVQNSSRNFAAQNWSDYRWAIQQNPVRKSRIVQNIAQSMKSSSSQPGKVNAETCFNKYQDELKTVNALHAAAIKKIESTGDPAAFKASKSADADSRVAQERTNSYGVLEKKFQDIQGQLPHGPGNENRAVTSARLKFDREMQKAKDYYDDWMRDNREFYYNKPYPKAEIDDARDTYEKAVNDAWESFKRVKDGDDHGSEKSESAASEFASELENARETFERKVNSLVDDFFHGIEEDKEEYEHAVDNAVFDYEWKMQMTLYCFVKIFEELVEKYEDKKDENSEQSIAQQETSENGNESDQLMTPGKPKGGRMSARMDNLEGKISEILAAVTKINVGFTSLQTRLEQEDKEKFLMDSLNKEMSDLRAAQIKGIESTMKKFKGE